MADVGKTWLRMIMRAKTGCWIESPDSIKGAGDRFGLGKPCRSVGSFDHLALISCDVSRIAICR